MDWIVEAQTLGAGEIVLNCIDQDGVRQGYDIAQLSDARARLTIPLVASGGAGAASHFLDVFEQANVSGALAASVFHTGADRHSRPEAVPRRRGRGDEAVTIDPSTLDFAKGGGLIPAIVQDADTLQVLTLAYMDRAALDETIASGEATFFSRSRGGRWRKGETSGNRLTVVSITPDCDGDALVLAVRPMGPACHLGTTSCFGDGRRAGAGSDRAAGADDRRAGRAPIRNQLDRPKLLAEGPNALAQKVGEEGVETALAGAAGPDEEVASEAADLIYHLLVLLRARHMLFQDVLDVLASRERPAKQPQ